MLNGLFKSNLMGSRCCVRVTISGVINSSTVVLDACSLMVTVIQALNFKQMNSIALGRCKYTLVSTYCTCVCRMHADVCIPLGQVCKRRKTVQTHASTHEYLKQLLIQKNKELKKFKLQSLNSCTKKKKENLLREGICTSTSSS